MTSALPRHIAIIMDGNGRWAARRGLPRQEGHKAGAQAAQVTIEECRRLGVGFLSLYAFSSENWSRPPAEITALFGLLLDFLKTETPAMEREGIRLNVIGDLAGLPGPQRAALNYTMSRTRHCNDMILNLALNYGGRAEIVHACQKFAQNPDQVITEETFSQALYTGGQPDPDLLIRTSGEMRLSNFLLYQCAYSELYFTDTLWPDFDSAALQEALAAFRQRDRRFGRADN